MEKVLRPEKLDIDSHTPDAAAIYRFWERTLKNLITSTFAENTEAEKLLILTQFVTYKTFPIIEDAKEYSEALELLQNHFIKPKNVCYARHLLITRKQKSEESINDYITALRQLVRDGNYVAVTGQVRQDEAIRDTLISGIQSAEIRQRILEQEYNLTQVVDLAKSMEGA